MRDERFEWDDAKAASNLTDHGITFEMARDVFRDPFALEREDRRFDYGEPRSSIIGIVGGNMLYVAFTTRDDRIRIISARGAERHERRLYHEAQR